MLFCTNINLKWNHNSAFYFITSFPLNNILLTYFHDNIYGSIVVVKSLSRVWLFATPWTAACQPFLSFIVSRSLLKLMSIELVMPPNHLILFRPLLVPSIFPSIRVFSSESALPIRWPKYWSFCISPSNEYSGLISFRIDWFELLSVQGALKSLLQHHDLKASVQHSAFLMVQLSHPYMTTGKTIALTWWTFVGNVISLLFNMLSRVGHRSWGYFGELDVWGLCSQRVYTLEG